ncbi:hypothetical protein [Palaeococcus ferrophilus]|uniref:hypothetical protein n=1 Tax=Palaeococcus ferrophilus TaxID=83868 RepID=UPI0014776690|nr:hypothetical protein [Palaeococcus ferrophilus]
MYHYEAGHQEKVPVPLSFSNDSSTSTAAIEVESTQTSTFSEEPTTKTSTVSETEPSQVNLSQEEIIRVNRSIQNFTQSLWEGISKYGYDNVTLTLATSIASLPLVPECENLSGYRNLSVYNERVSNLTVALHKYKNLAEGCPRTTVLNCLT